LQPSPKLSVKVPFENIFFDICQVLYKYLKHETKDHVLLRDPLSVERPYSIKRNGKPSKIVQKKYYYRYHPKKGDLVINISSFDQPLVDLIREMELSFREEVFQSIKKSVGFLNSVLSRPKFFPYAMDSTQYNWWNELVYFKHLLILPKRLVNVDSLLHRLTEVGFFRSMQHKLEYHNLSKDIIDNLDKYKQEYEKRKRELEGINEVGVLFHFKNKKRVKIEGDGFVYTYTFRMFLNESKIEGGEVKLRDMLPETEELPF